MFEKIKNKHIVNFDQERADKLAELGSKLHDLRVEKCLSIDEVAAHTMIRRKQLEAIEEGRLDRLPEPVYIRGFIFRFANALGMDGYALAQEFPLDQERRQHKFYLGDLLVIFKLRPLHLYLVYVLLILFSVKGLSQQLSQSALPPVARQGNIPESPEAPKDLEPATLPKPNQGKPPGKPAVAKETVPSEADKPVRVGLTFKEQSWIQIVADGKTEFEGTLPSGTERTWEANEQVIVVAGNAGGVLLTVNNGQAEPVALNNGKAQQMGEPDTVQTVTIKAKNPRS